MHFDPHTSGSHVHFMCFRRASTLVSFDSTARPSSVWEEMYSACSGVHITAHRSIELVEKGQE